MILNFFRGGDVIDLAAIARHNGDKKSAIHELAALTGVNFKPSADWVSYTQNLYNEIQNARKF